jgi:acyl-CoA thioesterase II
MDLRTLFDLAEHGPDTFVGHGPLYPWGGLYGGQIVAQALRAASSTIGADLEPHSLRAYFIRRGDHDEPVRYEVDRIRNGRSFATRRVVARQAIGAILNLEASYQRHEEASDVPTVLPPRVPPPDELESTSWTPSFERRFVPDGSLDDSGRTGTGRVAAWMRVNDELPQDELLHRCWLAYLSDDLPFDSVTALLARHGRERAYGASLDHTIWFHRPLRADEWHLQDFTCHGFVGGRGLAIGHVFSESGVHAATVAQEVLFRETGPTS